MRTMKLPAENAVPFAVVTDTFPVVAPAGTGAVMRVLLLRTKVVLTPLNDTFVIVPAKKLEPLIWTLVAGVAPSGALPLVGLRLVIVGGLVVIVRTAVLVPVPLGVVTRMVPVVAPTGTVTVMRFVALTV